MMHFIIDRALILIFSVSKLVRQNTVFKLFTHNQVIERRLKKKNTKKEVKCSAVRPTRCQLNPRKVCSAAKTGGREGRTALRFYQKEHQRATTVLFIHRWQVMEFNVV